jgi:hypothetical protein
MILMKLMNKKSDLKFLFLFLKLRIKKAAAGRRDRLQSKDLI